MQARINGSARPREADYAARWARGEWRGAMLTTERGDSYALLYEGRRGGLAGPDFRDAVLLCADGVRVYGDVELHLRTDGWTAHGHDHDPRYNGVVLHVVVTPLRTAAGAEVALAGGGRAAEVRGTHRHSWPCADVAGRLGPRAMRGLLHEAGMHRFMLRAAALAGEVCAALAAEEEEDAAGRRWTPEDRVLWIALAEGLGYGRDRAALRTCGERIAANAPPGALLSEALRLPRVEGLRLRGLAELGRRWETGGPWAPLRAAITTGLPDGAYTAVERLLRVEDGAVSRGRAAILAANVALPFAAAMADLLGTPELGQRALAIYARMPGLPSNTLTRLMARQLGMAQLPAGAMAQQGLHHLWAMACREKRCDRCPAGGMTPATHCEDRGAVT
jgi:hypothetical protein